MIKVKRECDGKVFSTDMSADESIIEIHFSTSYTQVIVQELVDGKLKCNDIICPPEGTKPNPIDLIATHGDDAGWCI